MDKSEQAVSLPQIGFTQINFAPLSCKCRQRR